MVELPGDKHLKDDERWVRHLLESTVGQTRVIDRRGSREEGKHDLEADLPGGGIAAIEITSEADPARLSVNAAARRHLSKITVPGSQFAWLVNVTTQADARALSKSTGLVALLADMERQGHTSASALSDYRDPWRDRLEAFGIQFVHGVEGSDHPGTVYVMPAIVASWGWVRPTADKWITDFLATELGKNKLDKLARADADERHLAVLIHRDTEAGLGIAVTDELPSVVPPAPLTHLWLIAPPDPPRALRWAHISGWAVVRLPVGSVRPSEPPITPVRPCSSAAGLRSPGNRRGSSLSRPSSGSGRWQACGSSGADLGHARLDPPRRFKHRPTSDMIGHDGRVSTPSIPRYFDLMWPALQATKELGGSATVGEMNERAMKSAGITEGQQAVSHKDGRMSEVEYRLHWARTHLKGIGALENSARGVWAVTDRGRSMSEPEMSAANKAWRDSLRRERLERRQTQATGAEGDDDEGEAEGSWRDQLIARLLELSPDGFERLAQRILREAGFVNVAVMGKSGDGGIDGMGTYRLSLVSFPVYFQCKRYKGTVASGTVRDFRGAMAGRGEKGLLITTGSFTRDAQAEATRDGAPPVELIDGDRLCDLLKEYRLGIEVRQRVEEDVTVNTEFFNEYQ